MKPLTSLLIALFMIMASCADFNEPSSYTLKEADKCDRYVSVLKSNDATDHSCIAIDNSQIIFLDANITSSLLTATNIYVAVSNDNLYGIVVIPIVDGGFYLGYNVGQAEIFPYKAGSSPIQNLSINGQILIASSQDGKFQYTISHNILKR